MKTIFIFIWSLLPLLSPSPVRAEEAHRVERLAAIVGYVVADYPGAVKGGAIVAADEYAEQGGLLEQAGKIAAALPEPRPGARVRLDAALGALRDAFRDKRPPVELDRVGRTTMQLLRDEWNLVLTPVGTPSRERAAEIYQVGCNRCHGADGRGETAEARKLKPPPVSFHDEGMWRISPELAFHALTFGLPGTAMASFESLPVADRWSLAFYVTGMRHTGADVKAGERVVHDRARELTPTISRLAALTDDELRGLLPGASASELADALAFLRREAPFRASPGGRFGVARLRLVELAAAADDHARARELAVAAYLEGIEPHEAALKAKDPALATRLEKAFLGLRQAIDAGVGGEALRREVARATLAVDTVEERATGDASVPFAAAFAIALREGFELSLLLAALLAFLRKAGRSDEVRFVHFGWLAAIPAGVATWFAIGAALSGARRELTEGLLTLIAAAMLLFVSHFVLGRLESRKWLKFLEQRTLDAGGRQRHVGLSLFAVAFIAAYREAIEIVLFFKALLLDSTAGPWPVVAGALAGALLLVAAVALLAQLGRRLDPRPLMMISSIVLSGLSISLVGQGMRALQEGGYLGLHALPLPSLPALGLYATAEGLAAQLVVLVLVVVPALVQRPAAGVGTPPKAA